MTGAAALALTPLPVMASDGMSVAQTVGVFVLIPFGIWGSVWLLWMLPKWRRDANGISSGPAWNPKP